jgi:hypothetical protein
MDAVADALRASSGPVTIALDEGGLRCTWRDGAAYVPFEVLADATLATSVFGTTVLTATLATGDEIGIKIANGNPFDVLGAILARLGERASTVPLRYPAFDRGELALGGWLENVRRHACGGEAYRESPPDRAAFAALLDDDGAGAAPRAAAAHALLTIGADEDVAVVAHALVTRAFPPLVLVAVGLAAGGLAFVDDELLAEMTALLPAGDREAAALVAAGRSDPAACARVAAALAIAKQAASDEARSAAEAHARVHAAEGGRRALHPVSTGAGNAGRWVGRSWGL